MLVGLMLSLSGIVWMFVELRTFGPRLLSNIFPAEKLWPGPRPERNPVRSAKALRLSLQVVPAGKRHLGKTEGGDGQSFLPHTPLFEF